jgi:hypothetical protein
MHERRRRQQAGLGGGRRRSGMLGAAAWVTALALMAAAAPAAMARGAVTSAGAVGAVGTAGAAETAGAQYALIVNGDDSFTHNYNVELALGSLRQLGFEPRNTFVLAPAATGSGDADSGTGGGGPAGAWRQPASEQGLRRALAELRRRLRPGDRLLVYLTGHGYRMFGRASLGLQNGSITARELTQRLGELPFGELILVADQCYSGAFVDAAIALGRNVVAVSSTDDRHEVRCEPFVRPLWLAAADNVSIEEAFRTASSGLRQAGGDQPGSVPPRYAASGSCAGRPVRFFTSPPPHTAAAAGAAGKQAGTAAAGAAEAAQQNQPGGWRL